MSAVAGVLAAVAVLLGLVAAVQRGRSTVIGRDRMTACRAPDRPVGRRLRRRLIDTGWPDALDLVVLTITAGYLPVQALDAVEAHVVEPIAEAFATVVGRCRSGARFADAVHEVSVALGPLASSFVDSLAAADRYGLPLAPVLARLADEARDHRRRTGEARARQLPVRLSIPLVLCTLPAFVLVAIAPLLIGALSSLRR